MFFVLGKILGPLGDPQGPRQGPLKVQKGSKEPNDIRHVGYQFYSDFRNENEYRVNQIDKINSKDQK